tara:strand:+ start:1008 stop:1199 length:192 start_codon:yes stop_codon:yes gene_type:complete
VTPLWQTFHLPKQSATLHHMLLGQMRNEERRISLSTKLHYQDASEKEGSQARGQILSLKETSY